LNFQKKYQKTLKSIKKNIEKDLTSIEL